MRRWFLNSYVQLGCNAIFSCAAEVLLKKGATSGERVGIIGIGALVAMWTWLGILAYLVAFASWLYVLRRIPLSAAFSLVTIVQVLIPIAAWLLLGERISVARWIGIGSVFCGTILVGRTLANVEEKT